EDRQAPGCTWTRALPLRIPIGVPDLCAPHHLPEGPCLPGRHQGRATRNSRPLVVALGDMATTEPHRTVVLKDDSLRQFDGGFTSIPNRILENNDLTLGARMTYAMLLKYAWQKDFCFPAQERIAVDLGVTARSVRTFLNELKQHGIIAWKQQGLNRPNIYY